MSAETKLYLDAFLKGYHDWTLNDDALPYTSKELRYYLGEQKNRLKKKGITFEESYEHVQDEISGALRQDGSIYHAQTVYRESKRILTYRRNGKQIKKLARPVNIYATMLDKEGYKDQAYTCPGCGHQTMASKLLNGCPYCGLHFEIDDTYPCFTNFYNVNTIVERASLMSRLKRNLLIIGSMCGVLLAILTFMVTTDYPLILRILWSLFLGGIYGALSAFAAYCACSIVLLMKVFREAGKTLPLLSGLKSGKKMEEFVRPYDRNFSFAGFEGRIIALFRTVCFSEKRNDLSIYTGDQDLSFLDDVVDMQYRGALQLRKCEIVDGCFNVEVKAFMNVIRAASGIREKNENYILTLQKEVTAVTDPGFSICKIQCESCGGSFDATHKRNCPHCGNEYDLKHDDWIITGIRKAVL